MKSQHLEITDLFKSAYLLCSGGDLDGIRLQSTEKGIVLFVIKGDNLGKLDRDYRSGRALVNPLQLRECLNHLRDILFAKLREERTRTDRPRKDLRPCLESLMKKSSD